MGTVMYSARLLLLKPWIQRHQRPLIAALGSLLLGTGVVAFGVSPALPDAAQWPVRQVVEPVDTPAASSDLTALIPGFLVHQSQVTRRDDSLQALLRRLGVEDRDSQAFLASDATSRLLLTGTPGKLASVTRTTDGRLKTLSVRWVDAAHQRVSRLVVEQLDGGFRSRLEQPTPRRLIQLGSLTIRSSFFAATDRAGLPDAVASQVVEAFAADIDFQRDLQPGARFSLVYEAFELDGEILFTGQLLGAEVRPVDAGTATLKDAMNDALRDWVTNVRDTFYCIGTVAGPHPYPAMVRDFQSIIGKEVRWQLAEQEGEGRLPDTLVAAIGGGSNAMGLFYEFLDEPSVNIVGVEAGGKGVNDKMEHCASLTGGRPGVLHGNRTYLLQDADGQILEGHSISAGLDYPGIGPEHSWLHDSGRAQYVNATDTEALEAFQLCCALEGIIPALEPSHALAHVIKLAPTLPKDHILVMNMCGRGDKDIFTVAKHLGFDMKA